MSIPLHLIGALLAGIVCGLVFTPVILSYCKRKKLYDIPNERKMHTKAIPRLGGLTFFPGMLIAFGICLLVFSLHGPSTRELTSGSACFLLGLTFIYVVGIIDDFIGLNAPIKFGVQIIVATLLPLTGQYLNNLYGLLGVYELPPLVGMSLTVFAVVFITNAVNLIDGIDGLAASLSILALTGFLAYFFQYAVYLNTYAIMITAVTGALLSFLYFNMLGRPEKNTKTFMGDGGSLFLGYMLGFLAVKSAMHNPAVWPYRAEALLVPITLLFLPAADVVRVTLHRYLHHKPLFQADKNHIHHKLMQTGMSQHQALLTLLVLALAIVLLNLLTHSVLNINVILLADAAIYCLANYAVNLKVKKHTIDNTRL